MAPLPGGHPERMQALMPYVGRAAYFAFVLLLAARVLDRHSLASEKPYDFAINITFGTLAGAGILDLRIPIAATTAAIAVLTAFGLAASALAYRLPQLQPWLVGRPVVIVRHGQPVPAGLRRLHMTEADLVAKLREQHIGKVEEVERAEIEPDGGLGVVRHRPPHRAR